MIGILSPETLLYAYAFLLASALAGVIAAPSGVARTVVSMRRCYLASRLVGSPAGLVLLILSLLFHILWAILLAVHGLLLLSLFYMRYGRYTLWVWVSSVAYSALYYLGRALLVTSSVLLAVRIGLAVIRRVKPHPWLVGLEAGTIAACISSFVAPVFHVYVGVVVAMLLLVASTHYSRSSRLYGRALLRVR